MYKRQMLDMKPTSVMKEIIYIKTNRIGYIPQIRMQGPIITPLPVTREAAKAMVVAGIEVYEVDKATKKVRLLTLKNVYPGEGDCPSIDENPDEEEGEQKPQVPTSGVVQQEPVQPVELKGVPMISDEENEDTTKDENLTEETEKQGDEESIPVVQNNNNKTYSKKNKRNKK